jgi:hypothetical protein
MAHRARALGEPAPDPAASPCRARQLRRPQSWLSAGRVASTVRPSRQRTGPVLILAFAEGSVGAMAQPFASIARDLSQAGQEACAAVARRFPDALDPHCELSNEYLMLLGLVSLLGLLWAGIALHRRHLDRLQQKRFARELERVLAGAKAAKHERRPSEAYPRPGSSPASRLP